MASDEYWRRKECSPLLSPTEEKQVRRSAVSNTHDDDVVSIPSVSTSCVYENNYVPLPPPNAADTLANWEVSVNLIKGSIGTGILGLPLAMKHAGIISGPIVLLIMGLISVHNMHVLIICRKYITRRNQASDMESEGLDYGELANKVLAMYGGTFGKVGSFVVNAFLCVVQFGFCCVYILFVADNIHQITGLWNIRTWATIILPCFIILSYVRSLKFIAYISAVSNVFALLGIAGVFVYLLPRLKDPSSLPKFTDFPSFALFFGQAVFAFEGIGVILPVEKKARNKRDFVCVMYASLLFVILLYFSVGFLGYMTFGDKIEASVTLNLPEKPFYQVVQSMYALAIYLTYFIQFYVPIEFLVPYMKTKFSPSKHIPMECFFRTILVLITYAIAIGIPQLGNSIALVGSLAGSAVLFVFPPFLHVLCIWETRHERCTQFLICKNVIIMVIGTVGAVAGTYAALYAIIKNE